MSVALVADVRVDDERITFVLRDRREVAMPTSMSKRLSRASLTARAHWIIGGAGTDVEWPDVDEHIGLWTILGLPEEDVLEAAGFEIRRTSVPS